MATPLKKKRKTLPLGSALHKNIDVIIELRREMERRKSRSDRIADAITTFSGSMKFLYIHFLWFGIWVAINVGLLGIPAFDPFPFGLLTMIVSLEAIFLSTFVLISQNRMGIVSDKRSDLDLQIDLLGEYEVTKILRMLDKIMKHLDIRLDDAEIKELEVVTSPERVLREIEEEEERKVDR